MPWDGNQPRIEGHLNVVRAVMDRDGIGIHEALDRLVGLVPAGDREAVIELWQSQTSTTITILDAAELSQSGPQPWAKDWDSSKGYYWPRQRSFLINVLHRKDFEIDAVDRASEKALSHLGDPHSPVSFGVRGLVVGYVQSGKTANFSAVIAKAADAGYKIVIVLSGLHNSLRQQTQHRLQRDLGHEDTPGVGSPEASKVWVWMTGDRPDGDFNPAAQNAGVLQGNNQVILVVKKNVSRLDRLIEWMRNRVPAHVPVLVIDDEADQASVNTGGNRAGFEPDLDQADLLPDDVDGELTADELNPSAINLRIRQLLRLFQRYSYVAYTATPFANVLIDPDAIDREGGDDLFPRNFIISLPKPSGTSYVGPERVFGRNQLPGDPGDVDGMDIIEIVPEYEVSLLIPPRRSHEPPEVTPMLQQAIRDFVTAAAARIHREGSAVPCTMLVHTDMRKALQDDIADQIEAELARMRQSWRYDPDQELRSTIAERWEREFRPKSAALNLAWDVPFTDIEPHLDDLINQGVPVRRLNSNHLDTANFDEEPSLKAVLVGGNKLSRGVTIEGLLVSFYVRQTPYYDTLLQMARWFGYRGDYIDLSRLYSTQLLISWFHDLATAEEDFRRQIELYEKLRATPLDFAPKIMSHPVMLVTAENKMRDAAEITQSYHGELVQTIRFPFGSPSLADHLQENLDYTRQMLSSLGSPTDLSDGRPGWSGISADFVQEFLENFRVIDQTAIAPDTVRSYIQAQVRQGELLHWRLLVCCAPDSPDKPARRSSQLGREDLRIADFDTVGLINRSRLAKDPTSLGVITDPADELFGLSKDDIADAELKAANHDFPTLGKAFRSKRSPQEGLLLIYPISGHSVPGRNAKNRIPLFTEPEEPRTVIGYAVSFPFSKSPATVKYIQGPASRRR